MTIEGKHGKVIIVAQYKAGVDVVCVDGFDGISVSLIPMQVDVLIEQLEWAKAAVLREYPHLACEE
jgi:hypothetical protein